MRFNLLVPSLSLSTRSLILAICQRLIVNILHRMINFLNKQQIVKGKKLGFFFSQKS